MVSADATFNATFVTATCCTTYNVDMLQVRLVIRAGKKASGLGKAGALRKSTYNVAIN